MNRFAPVETNPLYNPEAYHATKTTAMTLSELENNGGIVTRIRLLAEKRNGTWFVDVSYIDGTLPTGETVMVKGMPYLNRRDDIMTDLRQWADDEGVNAEDLNLLNSGIWSFLY